MRNHWWYGTLVLISLAIDICSDEVLLTREAEAYFQAGEYGPAKELFEKLTKEKLLPWQRSRLAYNIGTILMEQGLYDEALQEYSSILFMPQSAPYLSRALKTNEAILKYRQAKLVLEKEPPSLEDYSRAFYLDREAAQTIAEAEEAECALQLLEGREGCRSQGDLEELRSAVKRELAVMTERLGELKVAYMSVREGVPLLLSSVNLAESYLVFLERPGLRGMLKEKYMKLFALDLESWFSLWETQVVQLPELEKGFGSFKEGVKALQQDSIKEGKVAFLSSEAALTELMQALWGQDPFRDILQNLLTTYQRALDQTPIQLPSLYQLTFQQNEARELMQSGELPLDAMTRSDEDLKQSSRSAREGKRYHSRFYLLEARQSIRRLLRLLFSEKESSPEEVLENGIQEQIHALALNHLLRQMKGAQEGPEKQVGLSQQFTLDTVLPFLDAILKKEQKEWPHVCQCRPWDQVIPLFIKGEVAAKEAERLLKKESAHPLALIKQEEAVKYWKEALEKMRHPEPEEKKEEEKKEEPPPEPSPEKPSVQEVLRMLQNMAQDDLKPKPEKTPSPQGARPW